MDSNDLCSQLLLVYQGVAEVVVVLALLVAGLVVTLKLGKAVE